MDKPVSLSNKAKYSRYYIYIKPVMQNQFIKSFAPTIFSLTTVILLTAFVLRPTVATILNLQKTVKDNKQVLEVLTKKSQDLSLGRENLDSLGEQTRSKIRSTVPDHPSVTSLIANLQNAASASLSAVQVQPLPLYVASAPVPGLNLGESAFSINVQGSFSEILATLGNLSKAPRLIKIDNINIGRREGPTVLSVSGKAFFLK